MYEGNALAHQTLPRTRTPRVQGQPLQIIRDSMPTDAQLGEKKGREMAAAWTYERCAEWIRDSEEREVDAPDCDDAKREFRAGLRLGVAVRMAERGEESAR